MPAEIGRHALHQGEVRPGQVGGPADQFRGRGDQSLQASSGWTARLASFGLLSATCCFSSATASCQLSGSRPAIDALELATLVMPGEALQPGAARGGAAAADGVPTFLQVVGRDEGRFVPAEQLLGAGGFLRTERGAVHARVVPALVGAPRPMMVRQAISVGFLRAHGEGQRGVDLVRIMAIDPLGRPAIGGETASARRPRQDSAVSPSIETWLSSYRTVSLDRPRWPASAAASWLMPSIRSPSEAMTQVR